MLYFVIIKTNDALVSIWFRGGIDKPRTVTQCDYADLTVKLNMLLYVNQFGSNILCHYACVKLLMSSTISFLAYNVLNQHYHVHSNFLCFINGR